MHWVVLQSVVSPCLSVWNVSKERLCAQDNRFTGSIPPELFNNPSLCKLLKFREEVPERF